MCIYHFFVLSCDIEYGKNTEFCIINQLVRVTFYLGVMKKAFEIAIVSLIMTGLAIISTFPLVKNFTTGIPWSAYRDDLSWSVLNHPGDHLQLFYFFWLVKQNILGLVPFNANPYEFNMLAGQTAGNDGFTTAPLAFISFLYSPFGDIVAYNCTVITTYILAGVFMYLLARLITDFKIGALFVAITFTFLPLRINSLAGGNQFGFVLFFYPMIFYFFEKCIHTKKIIYSVLAALGIIGLSFNEPHLIYYFFLCMGAYLPIRFISLIPVKDTAVLPVHSFRLHKIMSWPPWLSLLIIWGGGVAIVLYAYCVIPRRGYETFFSPPFWWMIGYYPLIPLFLSIMLAFIYRHFSDKISPQQSLAIEAVSMLPLYLFPLMAFVFYDQIPGTTLAIVFAMGAVAAIKLWLLRSYAYAMVSHLWQHSKAMKGILIAFLPALLGMAATILLTLINKARSLAPSTESGGRTLHDVKLYSAHLQDLFIPTRSLYIGLIPISFGILFLCYLLYRAGWSQKAWQKPNPNLPLYAMIAVVLLVSQALAMGLALGNHSLYILFYHYMPFFNIPRVSERILSVTILALACVMAGVAHNIIRRRHGRFWTVGCSIVFLLLTVIQLKSYTITTPMAVTDLQQIEGGYQYIKENIGDGVLLELPLWPGDSHQSSVYEYYTTLDKVKRVNGYTPLVSQEYISTVFAPLHSLDRGELDENQYNLLRRLNVKYITAHEHRDIFTAKVSPYSPVTTVRRLTNSPYLEYLGPWSILNKKYDKIHERLNVFRVKEDVSSSDQNTYYTMPVIYRPGSRLRQQTGTITFDSSIGRKVYNAVPGRDKPGALVFGPYESFFSGKYSCYFRIKCSGNSKGKIGARIEVVRSPGGEQEILALAEPADVHPNQGYRDYYLDFEITKRERLEFRVYYSGTDEISLDKIVVAKKRKNEVKSFLEAEKMVGETGRIVSVEEASGQKVIEAEPGKDLPGRIVYGPDMKYDRGHYTAFFHLRRPNSLLSSEMIETAGAVVLTITGHQGSSVFARQAIPSSGLRGDKFKRIRMDFSLSEAEEVDFTVRFTNKTAIQLDGIEIIKNRTRESGIKATMLLLEKES